MICLSDRRSDNFCYRRVCICARTPGARAHAYPAPPCPMSESDGQDLAAACTTGLENVAACSGLHAGAEAMDLFMLTVFGLECSFHDNISSSIQIKNIYFIFPQVNRYCGSIYYCIVCLLYQNTRSIVNNESALFA